MTLFIKLLSLSTHWTLPSNQTLILFFEPSLSCGLSLLGTGSLLSQVMPVIINRKWLFLSGGRRDFKILEIKLPLSTLALEVWRWNRVLSAGKLARLRHMWGTNVCNRETVEIKINFLLRTEKDERKLKVYVNNAEDVCWHEMSRVRQLSDQQIKIMQIIMDSTLSTLQIWSNHVSTWSHLIFWTTLWGRHNFIGEEMSKVTEKLNNLYKVKLDERNKKDLRKRWNRDRASM